MREVCRQAIDDPAEYPSKKNGTIRLRLPYASVLQDWKADGYN